MTPVTILDVKEQIKTVKPYSGTNKVPNSKINMNNTPGTNPHFLQYLFQTTFTFSLHVFGLCCTYRSASLLILWTMFLSLIACRHCDTSKSLNTPSSMELSILLIFSHFFSWSLLKVKDCSGHLQRIVRISRSPTRIHRQGVYTPTPQCCFWKMKSTYYCSDNLSWQALLQ